MGTGIVLETLVIFNQLTLLIVSENFINLAAVKASDHTSDMLYFMEGNVPSYIQSSGMWIFQFKRFHRRKERETEREECGIELI
jgi:hypothetical protein